MLSESLALALHGSWPPGSACVTVTQFENSDVSAEANARVRVAVTTSPTESPLTLAVSRPACSARSRDRREGQEGLALARAARGVARSVLEELDEVLAVGNSQSADRARDGRRAAGWGGRGERRLAEVAVRTLEDGDSLAQVVMDRVGDDPVPRAALDLHARIDAAVLATVFPGPSWLFDASSTWIPFEPLPRSVAPALSVPMKLPATTVPVTPSRISKPLPSASTRTLPSS